MTTDFAPAMGGIGNIGMIQAWNARFERWTHPGKWASRLHAVAHRLFLAGIPFLPCLIQRLNHLVHGCDIHYRARIGEGLQIAHPSGIVIGRNVEIYPGVVLGVRETGLPGQPSIGDFATLYAGAKILGAVSVGAHAVVAANAVVTTDVAPGTVVGGIPARVLKTNDPKTQPETSDPPR